MQPQIITLIVAGLGITGTLGGILVGHVLSRSWQQRQWLQDRRNEEFRELLTALVRAMGKIANARDVIRLKTDEWVLTAHEASVEFTQIMLDRIFIAEDVKKLNLMDQWREAVSKYVDDRVALDFGDVCRQMVAEIVKSAKESKSP
jgi:hypothetical protein